MLLPARGAESPQDFSENKAISGSWQSLVVVVEVFIAQGDGDNALGDEGAQAVLDPTGVAVIGEAVRHLVKKRQTLLDPAQQQGAGIGSDGTARRKRPPRGGFSGLQTPAVWCYTVSASVLLQESG